ncbi:MAG: hypothetical protein Q7S83_02925 [bacterium]|nr:hypothetical protein [bacterium]
MKIESGPMMNQVKLTTSAEELFEQGKYDLFNFNIPFSAFPRETVILAGEDAVREVRADDAWLLVCDTDLKGDDARRMIDELGFKPRGVREILCLGINYPEEQMRRPIVAIKDTSGYHAYLYGDECEKAMKRRKIYVGSTSDYWESGCRFLCVKK